MQARCACSASSTTALLDFHTPAAETDLRRRRNLEELRSLEASLSLNLPASVMYRKMARLPKNRRFLPTTSPKARVQTRRQLLLSRIIAASEILAASAVQLARRRTDETEANSIFTSLRKMKKGGVWGRFYLSLRHFPMAKIDRLVILAHPPTIRRELAQSVTKEIRMLKNIFGSSLTLFKKSIQILRPIYVID